VLNAHDLPNERPGDIDLTERIETIVGYLSHLDSRLRSIESRLRDEVPRQLVASEARVASWVYHLLQERQDEDLNVDELTAALGRINEDLERCSEQTQRLSAYAGR